MKKQFNKGLGKAIFALVITIFATNFALAQGPGGPGDGNPDQTVPLDGASVLFLVMVGCFVIFKVWQHRRLAGVANGKA